MKEVVTNGIICLDDELGFTYYIGKIEYTEREDESFFYKISPNYSVIDLLSEQDFQGIPGLDLDLRKESYIRENIVPVFISERTPGENREDLWVLLESHNMQYLNRLEWLVRTELRYSGDGLYVDRPEIKNVEVSSIDELGNRSSIICRKVLETICSGGEVRTNDFVINDSNRKSYYELFMSLYKTERKYLDERRREGIKKSSKQGNYKGRTRIRIDRMELQEFFYLYETDKITAKEASERLRISVSTFFRRYREYKKESQ